MSCLLIVKANRADAIIRDIKPSNVFLAKPHMDDWPKYPQPMLADFGHAFMTSDSDPNNPRWYNRSAGTQGYMAPEQTRMIDRKTNEAIKAWPLSGKTDVYSIGAKLYCLLARAQSPQQPLWLGDGLPETTLHRMALSTDESDADDSAGESAEDECQESEEWNQYVRSYSNELRN